MTVVRSVARWGSLVAMIAGAAVSVGFAALVQACGGEAKTGDGQTGDADAQDGTADASDGASDASADTVLAIDALISDQQAEDIQPLDDVSLDTVPAE